MSLASALNSARTSLRDLSLRSSVLATNVGNADNPSYNRREVSPAGSAGANRATEIRTQSDRSVLSMAHLSRSSAAGSELTANRLQEMALRLNGTDGKGSAAAQLERLHSALQTYSASPSNRSLAELAIDEAQALATKLNENSTALSNMRSELDRELSGSVDQVNSLVERYGELDKMIASGRGGLDAKDEQAAVLRELSEYLPVRTIERSGGETVLMTSGSVPLYDREPRAVTFTPIDTYMPGDVGNELRIDGVSLAKAVGSSEAGSGKLGAMLTLRDDTIVQSQRQLDEMAAAVTSIFNDGDGTPLFTSSALGGDPNNRAGTLAVDPAYISSAGGDAFLLRDGAGNPDDNASYSGRIDKLLDEFGKKQDFTPATGVGGKSSLLDFAYRSQASIEQKRVDGERQAVTKSAQRDVLDQKLSNKNGVNIEEEMATLLKLESSYAASSRIISVVDDMLANLLRATG